MKKAILFGIITIMLLATAVSAKQKCTTIQSGELYGSDGSLLTVGYNEWGYNYQAHMFNGYYCDAYRNAKWCQAWKEDGLMMKWNDAWLSNKDCDGDGLLDRHYGFVSYIGSGAWLTNHQSGSYLGEWNLVGDWVLAFEFGSLYIHDMTIVDNTFTGTGAYPSGGPYSITWTVMGTVTGNEVDMTISYDGSSYYVDAVGTIVDDGTMSGTWSSNSGQSGTWKSTSGAATRETCNWEYFVKIVAAPKDATSTGGVWYAAGGKEIGPEIWREFAIIQEVENDNCAGIHGLQYLSPTRAGLGNW